MLNMSNVRQFSTKISTLSNLKQIGLKNTGFEVAQHRRLLQPESFRLVFKQNGVAKTIFCGYASCSYSGCNCQTYEGKGDTCANLGCGHSYQDHW
jgi:hypothetical protein